jgi:hypothetical protein
MSYTSLSKMLMKRKDVKRFGIMSNIAVNYLTLTHKTVHRNIREDSAGGLAGLELGRVSSCIRRLSRQRNGMSDLTGAVCKWSCPHHS